MLVQPLPVRAELSWVVWIMSDNPALAGGVRKLSRTFWVVQSLRSPKLGDICIFVCSYTHIFCDIEMYLYCHRGCFPRPWGYLEAREMRNIKNFMCLQKKVEGRWWAIVSAWGSMTHWNVAFWDLMSGSSRSRWMYRGLRLGFAFQGDK